MTPPRRRSLAAMVLLGALAIAAAAGAGEQPALRFANIFGDHMVLQQDKPVRIWGWAEPGDQVTVTIGEDPKIAEGLLAEAAPPRDDGQRRVTVKYVEHNAPAFKPQARQAKADAKGGWEATLDPMPAGFTPKVVAAKSGQQAGATSTGRTARPPPPTSPACATWPGTIRGTSRATTSAGRSSGLSARRSRRSASPPCLTSTACTCTGT